MLGGNVGNVIGLIGTGSILAAILLFAVAMVAGYFLGGPDIGTRRTLAMAAGQRNLAAAFVVAAGTFPDRPATLVFLAAAGLIAMIMMMPIAGWFGKRVANEGTLAPTGAEVADAKIRKP
jgi:predicted Na+-dependent transporter